MDDRPQDPTPQDPGAQSPPPPGSPGSPPARRAGRRTLLALLVGATVVVAGGASLALFMIRGSSEQLEKMVPAQADVFVTAYLDPSARQKMNLLGLTEEFPDLGGEPDLSRQVDDLLDEGLADAGLTHEDVRPWLGSQLGLSLEVGDDGTPHVAFLIATTDTEASQAALEKAARATGEAFGVRAYDGVQVSVASGGEESAHAIVDDVVVLASDETTVRRAIDAAHGTIPDISSSQIYLDTVAELPEGRLGMAFANVAGLVDRFGSETAASAAIGAGGLGQLDAIKGVGIALSAETDGIALDLTTSYDAARLSKVQRDQLLAPDHDNATLAFVPADAFAVMAQVDVDTSLRAMLDEFGRQAPGATASIDQAGIDDLLEAMTGDVAVELGPATQGPVSGALLVGTDDRDAMQTFLDGVAGFASLAMSQQGAGLTQPTEPRPFATEEYEGVQIAYLDDPALSQLGFAPAYAVVDGAGVIATTPEEIHQLIDTEASGQDVRTASVYSSATATVPSTESVFFLDIQGIASTVRENLPPEAQATYDRDVAPNIAPLTAFVVGSESDEEHQRIRVFLQIRRTKG